MGFAAGALPLLREHTPRYPDIVRKLRDFTVMCGERLTNGFASSSSLRTRGTRVLQPRRTCDNLTVLRAIGVVLNDVLNGIGPWVLACARMTTEYALMTNRAGRYDERGCRQLPTQDPEPQKRMKRL